MQSGPFLLCTALGIMLLGSFIRGGAGVVHSSHNYTLLVCRHGYRVSLKSFKGPFEDTSTDSSLQALQAKLEGQHLNLFFVNTKIQSA